MPSIHAVLDKNDFYKQLKDAGMNLVVAEFYIPSKHEEDRKINSPLVTLVQTYTYYYDVTFLQVDVELCPDLGKFYKICLSPIILFFRQEAKIIENYGAVNLHRIKELIDDHRNDY